MVNTVLVLMVIMAGLCRRLQDEVAKEACRFVLDKKNMDSRHLFLRTTIHYHALLVQYST